MATRPHRDLSAEELFRHGAAALRAGDRSKYNACLEELDGRKSRIAAELAEELAEEGDPVTSGDRVRPEGASLNVEVHDFANVALVTDATIVAHRFRMVSTASASIWLSTYQYADGDDALTRQLCAKARDGVAVRLFVSKGRAKNDDTRKQIVRLERGGVRVCAGKSTHSKCVVVDDTDVLIGSGTRRRPFSSRRRRWE